jgi:hypothetical protein
MGHSVTLTNLIALAQAQHTDARYTFLDREVYARPLAATERKDFLQLPRFTRALQLETPSYENLYHQLLYLFVLNGSRLNLLRALDRRVRGLADGQGALVLVSGVAGIGKTSLVEALGARARQLGVRFIPARCIEQADTAYAVWQAVARSAQASGLTLIRLAGKGPKTQNHPLSHLI